MFAVAGTAFWFLLAGPTRVLGIDAGHLGVLILVGLLWGSLWFVSTRSGDEMANAASPGEWQAWLGFAFLLLATAYFVLKLPLFAVTGTVMDNPDASRVGRNVVMLFISWTVLSSVMESRWKGVRSDERDRQIAARAQACARFVLVAGVVVVAVLLGFSPADRLQWATPLMLAHVMILILMVSNLVETAVQAVSYWRDRR